MKRYPMILAMGVFALNAQSIPGDPLPGLSAENLQLFQSGHAEFVKEYPVSARRTIDVAERAEAHSCSGCHQLSNSGWLGEGLIEGIPDEAILALQNRSEPLALGIRGRAAMAVDSVTGRLRVGRFGWKAQQATLLDASAENLARFIGIPETVSRNEAPDPVTGLRTIDRLAAYSRFLAPVGRMAPGSLAAQGDTLFGGIGCAVCHIRTIT